jgi:DNA-binding transcriptional LysR family regulator
MRLQSTFPSFCFKAGLLAHWEALRVRLPRCLQILAAEKATLLGDYNSTMAEVRRLVRGESERLRIGYLASALQEYLGPALAVLRRAYPKLTSKCSIIALRQGEIDFA